jgi:hypothetical protein
VNLHTLGTPPGLFRPFQLQKEGEPVRVGSTWRTSWDTLGTVQAALTASTFRQVMLSTQVDYNITHQLIHEGPPRLEVGDRFRRPPEGPREERFFYIREIENPGDLDLWTIYAVEERIEED